uniref:Uncharacterized protein n=1 Tax=Meloidogyne enterolobii TaxID=390850 RepID=A0A6V7W2E4_MELEN|nr:unnamed protein product [Meloidogyne enterolobii]
MPLATRPHFNNNHKQNHKSSPSIRRYDKSHDGISTKFKATTPPSAPISTDEIGFKSGPSTNYFERKNRPIIKDKGPCARVELMISARTLADRDFFSKSDPICIVEEMTTRYTRDDSKNEFVEIGRTECIKNSLNPVWNKRITLDYYFESKQLLRFKIYDIDSESAKLSEHDFLGKCECELADIVAAPNGICEMKVFSCKDVPRQGGLLLVCAEELDEGQRDIVHFSVRGVALNSGGSFLRKCVLNPNTFLEFYRLLCDGSRQMIYRTELARNTKNPEWKPFELRVNQLCKGDKGSDFLIECYDQREATGNHHLIGSTQTSLNALTSHQQNQLELIKTKKNKGVPLKVPKGILHFMDVQIRKEFTFLDFIASGLQLEFAVAVDLTASNGEISKSSSLHYVNSQYLNQYECAICAVLEICEHYNHSKMFETIGFGAKIPPAFTVSHMFPLRLNNFERSVEGIQGVLDAYRYAIVNTQLYGPTNFAPTIREFVHKCQQFPRDGTKYQVLLILTDGIITDMQNTIEALIEASHEPLSIIIIGIGKEDFKKMEFLDSDNRLLTYNGKVASRDIVQFVPFREFIGSAWGITPEEQAILKTLLGREVLAELPAQVCSFMKANSIVPLRSRAPSECAMKKPQIFAHKQLQLNSRLGSLNSTVNPDQQQSGTSLQNLPPDIERFSESVIAKPPYPEF